MAKTSKFLCLLLAAILVISVFAPLAVYADPAKTYTVSYRTGKWASENDTKDVVKEEGVDLTLEGAMYTCDPYGKVQIGWAIEDDTGTKVYELGGTYTLDQDIILYPAWKSVPTCTIQYHYDIWSDGSLIQNVAKIIGKDKTLEGALYTRQGGYAQKGWTTENNSGRKDYDLGATYTGDTDIILYPYFEKACTIQYHYDSWSDGSLVKDVTKTVGEDITLEGALYTRQGGYVQKGWTTENNSGRKDYDLGATYTGDTDIILYPYFEKLETVTIQYHYDTWSDGSLIQDATKTVGEDITLEGALYTRQGGYVQTGWTTENNSGRKDYDLGATYTVDEAIILYPYFSKTVPIHYSYDCWSVESTTKDVTKIVGEDLTLEGILYTRQGNYVQDGWTTESNSGRKDYELGGVYTGDEEITLYPYFKETTGVTYTVSYRTGKWPAENDTKDVIKQEGVDLILEGAMYTCPTYGKKQIGWAIEDDLGTKVYELGGTYTLDEDVILYPAWAPLETYTVSYRTGKWPAENDTKDVIKQEGVDLILEGAMYTCDAYGKVQIGWAIEDDLGTKVYELGGTYTLDQDITLYPAWESVSTCTIQYHYDVWSDGNLIKDVKKIIGMDKALEGILYTRQGGYVQDGWTTENNSCRKDYELGAIYAGDTDIVLYPYFKKIAVCKVRYRNDGYSEGDFSLDVEKAVDQDLTLEGKLYQRRGGYIQDGWTTTKGGEKEYELGGTYSGGTDLTLYPHYAVTKTLNIRYEYTAVCKGNLIKDVTKTVGEDITLEGILYEREGDYVQDGWSKTKDGRKDFDLGATYSDDLEITLYPHFASLGNCTITYHYDKFCREDLIIDVEKKAGEPIRLKGAIFTTPYNRVQDGWSTEDDGPKVYELGETINENLDMTLYPHWKITGPHTGDPGILPWVILMVAAAGAAVFFEITKKKSCEKA